MRDVVYKQLTSQDKKSQILTLVEKTLKGNANSTVTKQLSYLVKDQVRFPNKMEARNYISKIGVKTIRKLKDSREVYITKKYDAQSNQGFMQVKIAGDFLAINKGVLYTIHFCHSYRVIVNGK